MAGPHKARKDPNEEMGGYRKGLAEEGAPARVDIAAHRYPACIVWTPIHPISWVCPYVGHIGVCSSDGVVYDWVGMVNTDNMAFGWPARYVQLANTRGGCSTAEWDEHLGRSVALFNSRDSPIYDFCTWNCHSMVLQFMNSLGAGAGMWAGKWNLVNLCGLVFVAGRFTSVGACVGTFGPALCSLGVALMLGGPATALGLLRIAGWINLVFAFWFVFATLIGMSGMHGRVACARAPGAGATPTVVRAPALDIRRDSSVESASESDDGLGR